MTSLLLHNATLIDGTGADPRSGISVLVEDGRIARVGPAGALSKPADAAVIECFGRFVLPGLTDARYAGPPATSSAAARRRSR